MDDLQLVRRLYAGFNARDIEAVLSELDDDVVWANGMDGGHVVGRDAVRTYWTAQWASIVPHVEPLAMHRLDDGSIDVDVRQVVHDLEGALLLDETVRHVFAIAAGRVVRFDIRSASGLSSIAHRND